VKKNIKLCPNCYNSRHHQTTFPRHQFYEIIQPVVSTETFDPKEIQEHYAFCDECMAEGTEQHIKGLRFRCAVCFDYDLCEKCELVTNHFERNHPLVLIRFQEMRRQIKRRMS